MSKNHLLAFEGRLESMLRELSKSTARDPDLSVERASDPMDSLQRKEEIDLTALSLSTMYGRSREVHQALKRLRAGDYGICEDCGDAISPKRLEAAPWVQRCVGCQEEAERDAA